MNQSQIRNLLKARAKNRQLLFINLNRILMIDLSPRHRGSSLCRCPILVVNDPKKRRTSLNIKPNFSWMILAILTASILATAQTPTYQIFTPPSGIATNAGEPSIGADWKTGKILFQAVLETDRVTINPTNPPTATWEKVIPTTSS